MEVKVVKKSSYDYTYVDGKEHGVCKEYYPNGNLKNEKTFVHGERTGLNKWCSLDGSVDCVAQLKKGEINGIDLIFRYYY